MRRIAAHFLVDCGRVVPHPVVSLDDEGRIVSLEQWQQLDSLSSTEFYAGVLCAGFVNAHCHLELSYLRGAIARGTGFAGFACAIGQVRGNFSTEERQRALQAADARMWSEGVQAVADIVNDESSFQRKEQSRIYYKSFAELFGLNSVADGVKHLCTLPNCSPTPHSIYSVQDEAFRSVAELAADEPLSIHFMESPDEAALYSGEGSLAAWYERMGWTCDFLHYGSPAKRITGSLPGDKRLMLVHNCCVAEEDIELINNHFVNPVAWVLCPRSNDYISGLKPPVELLRRHSDMICVGTDSLASNDSLSIIEELKMFEGVPLAEVVKWATINGARALGVEKEIGSVEVGKCPGLVLIEGVEYADDLRLTPHSTSRRII